EDVTESSEAPPIHLGVPGLEVIWQTHDRLCHDLEVVQNGALDELVSQKLRFAWDRESFDSRRACQGVQYEDSRILQIGTASRKTWSLSSWWSPSGSTTSTCRPRISSRSSTSPPGKKE